MVRQATAQLNLAAAMLNVLKYVSAATLNRSLRLLHDFNSL
jgi:hypothetical protein